jgi:hypothetical protein
MSLVDLVISDAVENQSNSVFEKDVTLANNSLLIFLEVLAAVLAARKLTIIEHSIRTREIPIILIPVA